MDDPWPQALDEDLDVFNFHDILECGRHRVLYHVVRMGLSSFSLQAFQDDSTGQTFYHFYFELDEEFMFVDGFKQSSTVCGLALWMECDEDNGGELNVQFVFKERPFHSPLVSFEFPLVDANMGRENDLNLLDIIGTLQGNSKELKDLLPNEYHSNLLRFRFSPLTRVDDEPRGYRDALLQWFIRLNKMGYVEWSTVGQGVEDVVLNMQDSEETPTLQAQMFSSIIGHKFTADGSLDDGFRVVEGVPVPIRHGV